MLQQALMGIAGVAVLELQSHLADMLRAGFIAIGNCTRHGNESHIS
jgi:hypothetical protein